MTQEQITAIAREYAEEIKPHLTEGEICVPIDGYPSYFVTSYGRVFSFRKGSFYEKKLTPNNFGYLTVGLSRGNKTKTFKVHRLVALAFIPNPFGYDYINHKDEIKNNNRVDNLEWCSRIYNVNYGTAIMRKTMHMKNHPSLSIMVAVYDKNGFPVAAFPSMEEASRLLGIDVRAISNTFRIPNRKTCGGYIWREINPDTTAQTLFGNPLKEVEEMAIKNILFPSIAKEVEE